MEYLGHVRNGQIALDGDIALPEGAQVVVSIVTEDAQADAQGVTGASLLAAPVIGAWADRDDIEDTAGFAEMLRQRSERRD